MTLETIGATGAPSIILQTDRVRRRIATSDSVAALVAALAFGEPRRSDLGMLSAVTASRCAAATAGCR